MTEPGAIFLPKPSWWVRRDRSGYNTGAYGWASTAVGGAARIGRGATSNYGWTSSVGRGSNRYDNFNRANSTTSAGPNWVTRAQNVGVHSNRAYPTTGFWCAATWNTPMPTDNFFVSANIYTNRTMTNGATSLFFGCDSPGTKVLACMVYTDRIGLMTFSSWPTLGYSTWVGSVVGSPAYTSGDLISVERSGNVYTVRLNGTPCWTWTDSAGSQPIDSAHRLVGIGGVHDGGIHDIDNFLAREL